MPTNQLTVSVAANTVQLGAGLKQAQTALTQFATASESRMERFSRTMRRVTVGFGAVAVGVAALVRRSADAVVEMDRAAFRAGISAERYQVLSHSLETVGSNFNELQRSAKGLVPGLIAVAERGDEVRKAFLDRLGVDAGTLLDEGQIEGALKLLDSIRIRYQDLARQGRRDEAEALVAEASSLFALNRQLANTFTTFESFDGFLRVGNEAKELGAILDVEFAGRLDTIFTRLDLLSTVATNTFTNALFEGLFGGAFSDLDNLERLRFIFDSTKASAQAFGETTATVINTLVEFKGTVLVVAGVLAAGSLLGPIIKIGTAIKAATTAIVGLRAAVLASGAFGLPGAAAAATGAVLLLFKATFAVGIPLVLARFLSASETFWQDWADLGKSYVGIFASEFALAVNQIELAYVRVRLLFAGDADDLPDEAEVARLRGAERAAEARLASVQANPSPNAIGQQNAITRAEQALSQATARREQAEGYLADPDSFPGAPFLRRQSELLQEQNRIMQRLLDATKGLADAGDRIATGYEEGLSNAVDETTLFIERALGLAAPPPAPATEVAEDAQGRRGEGEGGQAPRPSIFEGDFTGDYIPRVLGPTPSSRAAQESGFITPTDFQEQPAGPAAETFVPSVYQQLDEALLQFDERFGLQGGVFEGFAGAVVGTVGQSLAQAVSTGDWSDLDDAFFATISQVLIQSLFSKAITGLLSSVTGGFIGAAGASHEGEFIPGVRGQEVVRRLLPGELVLTEQQQRTVFGDARPDEIMRILMGGEAGRPDVPALHDGGFATDGGRIPLVDIAGQLLSNAPRGRPAANAAGRRDAAVYNLPITINGDPTAENRRWLVENIDLLVETIEHRRRELRYA